LIENMFGDLYFQSQPDSNNANNVINLSANSMISVPAEKNNNEIQNCLIENLKESFFASSYMFYLMTKIRLLEIN